MLNTYKQSDRGFWGFVLALCCVGLVPSFAYAHGVTEMQFILIFSMVFTVPIGIGVLVFGIVSFVLLRKGKDGPAKKYYAIVAMVICVIGGFGGGGVLAFLFWPVRKWNTFAVAYGGVAAVYVLNAVAMWLHWKLFQKNRDIVPTESRVKE